MIEQVAAVVASPWILPLLFVLCVVDGFLPPVVLVPVAALGAFAGDQIAYRLGAQVPMERRPWFRSLRGRQRVRVRAELRDRGTALILAARFVPVARVGSCS